MTQTDIAYIAGIIDGEGHVGIKKSPAYRCQDRATPTYIARIQIRMVDEGAIRFIAETLGGWYYKEKAGAANRRPLYCYQAGQQRAEDILRTVLPFLRVKRAVAEAALALRDAQRDSRAHRTKVVGFRDFPNSHGTVRRIPTKVLSDEYVARCDALHARCKELNAVGI